MEGGMPLRPICPRSRSSKGFAFCNFSSPRVAEKFYHTFHRREKGREGEIHCLYCLMSLMACLNQPCYLLFITYLPISSCFGRIFMGRCK